MSKGFTDGNYWVETDEAGAIVVAYYGATDAAFAAAAALQRSSKATEAAALEGWCKSQELCYAAVAHLQLALQQKEIAEAEGEGFGLLVARATLAEECLSRAEAASAAALARTPEAPRLQTAKLRVAVDALLKMAKRDNQLVYMEPVPKISALPPLEESSGLRGTTQVSLQDVLPPNRQAELQLSALLPAGVRALADEYQALFQGLTAQVNEEANGLLSRVATFLQKEQLPSALRSRLAAAQEAPQRQQRGQQHWCDEQGQVPPLQSNKGTNPDLHFQFSSTCSQELLSVQSLGGAQRLRQQQQMLEQLSASAGIHLATVQHQLQSQLQLLVQQRQQQQTSSTQDEFQVHEQQFLALECKTKELIECACLYATKLQQAQKANEMIGSRMYEALGPLKLLPCMATLQNDRISGTTVGLEKAFAQAPTLEQLLCATKKDAEQLVQKLLLRLHISVVDSTQHHPLLQQRLDAAHAALVELESRIYSLQEDQHKLCQSEHLIPEHVLQQLRQAAATSPDPAASVCTAATSASLREAARSTRKRIQEVVLQLEAAQQRWSELLAAESGEAELQKQKQHKLASELQQVVQQQASRLRKAFGEQQQGVAFYSQLQGFLQQLQQHQQQLLKDMNACIRSVHQQQKEHQEKLRALPKELQQEHINQINPLQAPQWPNAGTLSTRSGRSSIGSSDRSGSSTPAPANWRRYSCGPLVLPGSKPRRLSSADNSKNKHYCGAAAAAPERLPSFPSPDSTNGSSSSQQRCEEATENRNSINIAGASFALAHSPIRARNSRHSTSTTNRSFPDAPAAAPCSPRCTPQDTDTDTVFRGAEPLASLHATDHASNS
ncbi:hypothetical protein, conserved [Eimeria tenella]|uniref:BRO1 domain-containing protein n=1 Tax=Eimeria tenella TaxID=5802 RepID=U6KXS7_EIMTE|nr:hypothetical protein, conserved [Eimeria tenella]CDJ40300.1 hypothetical protein, conserved [Eimeria tenella]|eukprot:XP_013231053.1 hypothetical protein, conserved [Eimeria tenella]